MSECSRLMTISEVSQRLGVSTNTMYAWVSQRKIPFTKVGRLVRFDQRDIEAWLAERKVTPVDF